MRLSAAKVNALRKPGRYTDGQGLHLFIGKTGNKSWVQRITVDRKRRDIGLGGFPAVSLAQARGRSADIRAAVAQGYDPLVEKLKPKILTLKEAACTVHKENKPRWRNGKHAAAWISTLERYAFPMIGEQTHRQNRARRRADGPDPHLVNPARDGTAGAPTATHDLSLGDGVRPHREQPGGRGD